jgi:hypothetical protein
VARVLDQQRTQLLQAVELDPAGRLSPLAIRLREAAIPNPDAASANPLTPKVATAASIKVATTSIGLHTSTRANLLRDCLCGNVNPPCPPCDDPRVLLASLSWEDCKVTDLCTLVRKWVITPNALRYWIPAIGEAGRAFEGECCDSIGCEPVDEDEKPGYMARLARMALSLYVGAIVRTCRLDYVQKSRIASLKEQLQGGQLPIDSLSPYMNVLRSAPPSGDELARSLEEMLDRPEVLDMLQRKLGTRVNP